MYAYIKGIVAAKGNGAVVIENNGIGYQIYVWVFTEASAVVGETIKLLTYLYVKEDVFMLYGFKTQEEKNFFEKLITVSGVGAKSAMGVLGGYPLSELLSYVASGNVNMLTKIKGLGKKTAERIVLELKEQFKAHASLPLLKENLPSDPSDIDDAVFALTSLGLSKQEATRLALDAAKEVSGLENIIAYVLKRM